MELGAGWEDIRRDGTDGFRPGQEYTTGQLEIIKVLNTDFSLFGTDSVALSKALNPVARVIYFWNMDVASEDISVLCLNTPSGTQRETLVFLCVTRMKQQLQGKIWGSTYFWNWVREPFTRTTYDSYEVLSVEEKKAFWDSRINLTMVKNLFRPLQPVDVGALPIALSLASHHSPHLIAIFAR